MKSRLLLFSLFSSLPLTAADFQWDVNGNAAGLGGAGTWNTTNTFWDATASGANDGTDTTTAYTFTTADKAIFGGTGGSVSVGPDVSLNQLSVDTTGYSFTGSRITFGGTGATLTANADFTIANPISGSFTKDGTGAVTITGLITFNTVTVTAGTLTRQASGDNDSSASIVNGGTLILASTAANSTSNVTLNSGTVRLNGTNDVQIWNGGTVTLNGGTFEQNGKNETVGSLVLNGGSITGLGTLTSGSVIDARSGSSATILGGTLGLTKTTAGTVILSAANTYTGTTTISGGTLQVGSGGATGSLGPGVIVNNANLVYNLNTSGTASLPSGGITGSGDLSATAGVIKFNGNITQGGALSFTQVGTAALYKGLELVAASTTLTASSITLSGDVGKANSDGNSLALNTSATNGTINLDISLGRDGIWYIPSAFSANAGTGTINITGSGLNDTGWRNTPVTLTGAVNMTGSVNSSAAVTINATANGTVSGAFSGGMSLTKSGDGTLTLSVQNTFSGNVLVSAGELQTSATNNVRSLGADTAGRTVTVASGATLKFMANDAFGNGLSTPNPALLISGTVTNVAGKFNPLGNVTLSGGLLTNLGGVSGAYQAYSLAGSVTVNGTSASSITTTGTTNTGVHLGTNTSFNVADATGSAAADLTVSAPLINRNGDLGGAGGLTKSGAGTMTLSAINTYTGATTVSAGTLAINGDQSAATGAVSVAAGATNATAVRLKGIGTVGGNTAFAADPDAAGAQVGGIHSPGNSVGKQTFDASGAPTANLTYNTGSIFEWELASTPAATNITKDGGNLVTGSNRGVAYDAVNVTGTLGGSGAIFRVVLDGTQDFSESFWTQQREWTDIFRAADHVNGQVESASLDIASIFTGGFQYYNYSGANGTLAELSAPSAFGSFTISGSTLTWSAVPEPTSALVGLLIGAGLLRRRRN